MSSSSSTTSITLSIPGQERRSKFISFVNSRNLIGYNIYHRHRNQNYTSATITKDYLIQHEHGEKQFKTLSAAAVDVVKKLSNDNIITQFSSKSYHLIILSPSFYQKVII